MAGVPSTYAHADKLGADGRAALAGAWLVWGKLKRLQQEAMADSYRCAHGRNVRIHRVHQATRAALTRRGLLINDLGRMTVLGLLVHEAGTRSPKETS